MFLETSAMENEGVKNDLQIFHLEVRIYLKNITPHLVMKIVKL